MGNRMDTQRTTRAIEHPSTGGTGFARLLVVTDHSDSARAAFAIAREWAELFGAELRVLEVSEAGRGSAAAGSGGTARPPAQIQGRLLARGSTLGARNRRLAEGIAEAARDCGADAIVLGIDRHRSTQRHIARSLREQLARASELPVLIAPVFASATETARSTSGPHAASVPSGLHRELQPAGRAAGSSGRA